MKYKYDLFISYAHIDNLPLREGTKGWIDDFHYALDVRIAQILGRRPNIWRDPKLQGNDIFGKEILDKFDNVAVFIMIGSPRYIESDWCLKEILSFIDAIKKETYIGTGNKSRIFKVSKTPTQEDSLPDEVKSSLGYRFYNQNLQTGKTLELNRCYGAEVEQAYWSKLDDLAHDISELLRDISKIEIEAQQQKNTNEDKVGVYLADCTYDLLLSRDELKRFFEDHGCLVYPNTSLPLISTELKKHVELYLEKAKLSFHIVGNSFGIIPEGEKRSITALQNEFAANRSSQSGLKRIIWIPPNTNPHDEWQKTFLEELRTNHNNALCGADIIEGTLDEAHRLILEHIAEIVKPKQPELTRKADGAIRNVYLICDKSDVNEVTRVEDVLFENGIEVVLPVFDGDEADVRQDHKENLRVCDASLIYFGTANDLWLRAKSRDLLKAPGFGRTKPMLVKGVFIAPPQSPSKNRFRSHEYMVINGLEGKTDDVLGKFIEQVRCE